MLKLFKCLLLLMAYIRKTVIRGEKHYGTIITQARQEMQLNNINTANDFLPLFISDYNKRFAIEATSRIDAHRKTLPEPGILDLLMSKQAVRRLSKNLEGAIKMLYASCKLKPQVTLCEEHI